MNRNNDMLMDALSILSFVMGVLNYNENVDQSMLQNTAHNIMQDIHRHLAEQDAKIDEIMEILKKEA